MAASSTYPGSRIVTTLPEPSSQLDLSTYQLMRSPSYYMVICRNQTMESFKTCGYTLPSDPSELRNLSINDRLVVQCALDEARENENSVIAVTITELTPIKEPQKRLA